MDILLASSNKHKKSELQSLLTPHCLHTPDEYCIDFHCIEDGFTFMENATKKASALFSEAIKAGISMPVLSDDSGLIVDALPGQLGIHTARYGSPDGITLLPQAEKNNLLLSSLKEIPREKRTASFVCCLVFMQDVNRIICCQEEATGYILNEVTGTGGFGYDPVFFCNEANSPMALLTPKQKNVFSHRGKAASLLKKFIG